MAAAAWLTRTLQHPAGACCRVPSDVAMVLGDAPFESAEAAAAAEFDSAGMVSRRLIFCYRWDGDAVWSVAGPVQHAWQGSCTPSTRLTSTAAHPTVANLL